MVTVGAAVSTDIPPTVVDAVLPALSVAVPERDCAAPLVLSTSVAGQAATPDSASVQVKIPSPACCSIPRHWRAATASANARRRAYTHGPDQSASRQAGGVMNAGCE